MTVAHATLYIPALALPHVRPAHPHVWGSGPYMDDSDINSATVHAGHVRWSKRQEVRRHGRDAHVEVQVLSLAKRYFGSWVPGLSLVRVVTLKTTGGGSSALDGATDTKAWESRFWKCLLSRCATSQFTFSLLRLRLLTSLAPFVRAGRNGASCAWSRATESQAAPRRVCCGAWGGTGICGKCCHVWCSWWADEPHAQRRCWWARWA